jgi:hypothetical protein
MDWMEDFLTMDLGDWNGLKGLAFAAARRIVYYSNIFTVIVIVTSLLCFCFLIVYGYMIIKAGIAKETKAYWMFSGAGQPVAPMIITFSFFTSLNIKLHYLLSLFWSKIAIH